jgi:hypothetical protein
MHVELRFSSGIDLAICQNVDCESQCKDQQKKVQENQKKKPHNETRGAKEATMTTQVVSKPKSPRDLSCLQNHAATKEQRFTASDLPLGLILNSE